MPTDHAEVPRSIWIACLLHGLASAACSGGSSDVVPANADADLRFHHCKPGTCDAGAPEAGTADTGTQDSGVLQDGAVLDAAAPPDGSSARGKTWTAASCAAADVQRAIDSASSGDTVVVPAGSCSWSGVSIAGTKGITLAGGSGGQTTIAGAGALTVETNATAPTRITGFTFTGSGGYGGDVEVGGAKVAAPYRVDHNTFTSPEQSVFLGVGGNGPGLIDHNTFVGGGASETIHNTGVGPSDTSGWTDDVLPGGPNMVFIEDNTFDNSDTTYIYSALQSYYGARTVFRHNTLNFAQVDQHGTSGMIGARWYEIYENTFQPHGLNQCCFGAFRAGSGVVFDNHEVGAPEWGPAGFDFYEEDTGTWPLAFQVGSGINGHTNQHATCASGTRNSSPVYLWGNDTAIDVGSQTPSKVVQGRDYFVSAAQPAAMYRQELGTDSCATTYSYAPYGYPHPLDANGLPTP